MTLKLSKNLGIKILRIDYPKLFHSIYSYDSSFAYFHFFISFTNVIFPSNILFIKKNTWKLGVLELRLFALRKKLNLNFGL